MLGAMLPTVLSGTPHCPCQSGGLPLAAVARGQRTSLVHQTEVDLNTLLDEVEQKSASKILWAWESLCQMLIVQRPLFVRPVAPVVYKTAKTATLKPAGDQPIVHGLSDQDPLVAP